jgi:hypothetical protein
LQPDATAIGCFPKSAAGGEVEKGQSGACLYKNPLSPENQTEYAGKTLISAHIRPIFPA